MNRFTVIFAGCALAGVAFGQGSARDTFDTQDDPPAIVHWARGHGPDFASRGGSRQVSLLTNHGGPVLSTTKTMAIFWGTSWGSYSGDIITGLDKFYNGVGGSKYAGTTTEYSGSNGKVTSGITYLGHTVDTSASTGGSSTGAILGEVCKVVGGSAVANGFYAVYTDTPRGNAGYCAWHSAGSCGGSPLQFAFFFKLDGDPGCDPQSSVAGESQGLAALANVSGHELSETMTDPQLNAWFDRQGAENADKCAWTFGHPSVTFTSNGSTWKIQGNWSNAAYNARSGYDHAGCIDGN